jgi:hypothetical protein
MRLFIFLIYLLSRARPLDFRFVNTLREQLDLLIVPTGRGYCSSLLMATNMSTVKTCHDPILACLLS